MDFSIRACFRTALDCTWTVLGLRKLNYPLAFGTHENLPGRREFEAAHESACDMLEARCGVEPALFRGVNKGDRLTGDSLTSQGVWRCVEKYSDVAPHDLRRTYAKLAHKGGAKLDQIQLSLGHASLTTTERYLGVHQDLHDAPCDYIKLDLSAAE